MVINILDHVKTASSYEDGQIIFNLIKDCFKRNEPVTLSFDNIPSVPSAFINSALLQLLDSFSFDFIKQNLTFTNTTKYINDLIKSRFSFVLSQHAR